ncbi:MAG TPA: glucan 1,4-alpha-glucosidase [Casimicrobiaceae bacterium]|nr:glucan 1,4-alpha-glucosidase [Casimicrobiaceae bacterium]
MTPESETYAPGWPGIPARWTSSAKTGLGTAVDGDSRVWFTLSHGILNEVYYPRIDSACTRDLGLIVTDGQVLFSEEKRDTRSETSTIEPGIPCYRIRNVHIGGRYEIHKEVHSDPSCDVVLQRVRFVPCVGTLADYALYALLAPHLANHGAGNTGWSGEYKGIPMLFAERDGFALALACSAPWIARSVGFVGTSDGWQQLRADKRLLRTYERAENGNVALTGQVDLVAAHGTFVLALGFGPTGNEAAQHARTSLLNDFNASHVAYVNGWKRWHQGLQRRAAPTSPPRRLHDASAAVLRVHESKRIQGGVIASLSIPWGFSKGDDDLGGYHLVWPRDLVETAGGFLAVGAHREVRRILRYLQVTQEADGHWAQNMWLDGTPYWSGIQMDETALPILLVDLAGREGALDGDGVRPYWPMVERAATFILRNGPVSPQDRWEEDPGYSPFTVATEIAALLVAAELAEGASRGSAAAFLRETADAWNASIERWLYVEDTELARRYDVKGYYVRVSEPDQADAASPCRGFVPIKNRPPDQSMAPAATIVSVDALALVRFGLRRADDPRILDTVKLIDALLKVDTPRGPAWRRYQGDGYGEHADGRPFDGVGIGRAWPLLTGERAHFELAAGRTHDAGRLASAMEAFAGASGLIPEQVWDAPDVPEHELYFGHASGSASPLAWAHAEYLKLCRSLRDGAIFDRPAQTVARYLVEHASSTRAIWSSNNKVRTMPCGSTLRVQTFAPARVHWGIDGWQSVRDCDTRDTTLGVYVADLPTDALVAGSRVDFTFYWRDEQRWDGTDFCVHVTSA